MVIKENKSVGFYDKTTGILLYEGEFTYLLSDPFPMEEINLRYMKFNVLKFLYKGGNPHSIADDLNIKRPTVIQHLEELEKIGLVCFDKENGKRKYASPFKISEKGKYLIEKSVGFPAKSSRVGRTNRGTLKPKEDDVNGHAFVFTLIIPKDLNECGDRRKILDEREIKYEELNHFFGKTKEKRQGERLIINGRKIHFTNKSIVIYESTEYISILSKQSKSKAIYHFEIFLRIFERIFGMNLKHSIGNSLGYKYRVSRQHYALIQNSLARQYNTENKKLEVYNGRRRIMYLIDNSQTKENPKGENHFEAVNSKTSDKDINPAQNFFKELPNHPTTTKEILGKFKEQDIINNELLDRLKKSSEFGIGITQVLDQIQNNQVLIINEIKKLKD